MMCAGRSWEQSLCHRRALVQARPAETSEPEKSPAHPGWPWTSFRNCSRGLSGRHARCSCTPSMSGRTARVRPFAGCAAAGATPRPTSRSFAAEPRPGAAGRAQAATRRGRVERPDAHGHRIAGQPALATSAGAGAGMNPRAPVEITDLARPGPASAVYAVVTQRAGTVYLRVSCTDHGDALRAVVIADVPRLVRAWQRGTGPAWRV